MFGDETISVWRSMLHDDNCNVRQEALNVLGLALHYSTLLLADGVCAYAGTGDLRQRMFNNETVAVWRRSFYDDAWDVRQEARNVLGLAIYHSMVPLLG